MRRPIVLSPALLKRETSDKPLHFFRDVRDLVQLTDQFCADVVVGRFVFPYRSTSQMR